MRLSTFVLSLIPFFIPEIGSTQIVVQTAIDTSSIRELTAQNGLNVFNVQVKCDSTAYGEFSGYSELPISHGLFISTGKGSDLFRSNQAENTTTSFGTQDTIIGFDPTNDVCAIEFDARSNSNTIEFIFSFGSEEYPEYVFSPYNDEFAILISGPRPTGGQYINMNIAWLPDNTSTCISHLNSFSNMTFFYDNTFPQGRFISYDGLSAYFTASLQVIPDSTYHVTFVIGDENDSFYDSGGFIAAEDSDNHALPVMPPSGVDCYPNPVVDELTWLPAQGVTIYSADLYNELGQLVYAVQDPMEQRSIDMSNYSCGYYMLHIETAFRVYTFRVIKI